MNTYNIYYYEKREDMLFPSENLEPWQYTLKDNGTYNPDNMKLEKQEGITVFDAWSAFQQKHPKVVIVSVEDKNKYTSGGAVFG